MPICRYFIQGKCKYGAQCVNEHPRVSHPTAIPDAQYTAPHHQQSPRPPKPNPKQQQNAQWDQGTPRIRQPFVDGPHRGRHNGREAFSHQSPNRPIPPPQHQQTSNIR